MTVPGGYQTVTPYLIATDAAALLEFMAAAFDAEETECIRLPDGTIKHAEVQIGTSRIMIGQAQEQYPSMPTCLYLHVEDVDAAWQKAVDAGGQSVMEPTNQAYGDRSGGVTDPVGNQWWMATPVEDLSTEELERRLAEQESAS